MTYKDSLNRVLNLLTEEQIALVFSELCSENQRSDEDSPSAYTEIVALSRCPDYIKERYVLLCSKWLYEDDRWDRRGTGVYAKAVQDYLRYLPKTEMTKLTESLSRFMEKPGASAKDIRKARTLFNLISRNIEYPLPRLSPEI